MCAKDPRDLKATMGDITDMTGTPVKMDNEKKHSSIRDHFGWRKEGRKVGKDEEETKRYPELTGIS